MRGPGISGAIVAMNVKQSYSYKDNEKFSRLKESCALKLKNLTGVEPDWNRSKLYFTCEMNEEQAKEMSSWVGVKKVMLLEDYNKKK